MNAQRTADLGFARLDLDRAHRTGTPEVVYSAGKTPAQTVAVSGGSFSVTHQYLDDNPTGTASDLNTISLTLTDDDTGTATAGASVTVTNVAPTLSNVQVSAASVSENGTVTLTVYDPAAANVCVTFGPPA